MRKNFGKQTCVYPMPVFIVGTYDENDNADAMNAAWGGIYDDYQIAICIAPNHKTAKNILLKKLRLGAMDENFLHKFSLKKQKKFFFCSAFLIVGGGG